MLTLKIKRDPLRLFVSRNPRVRGMGIYSTSRRREYQILWPTFLGHKKEGPRRKPGPAKVSLKPAIYPSWKEIYPGVVLEPMPRQFLLLPAYEGCEAIHLRLLRRAWMYVHYFYFSFLLLMCGSGLQQRVFVIESHLFDFDFYQISVFKNFRSAEKAL